MKKLVIFLFAIGMLAIPLESFAAVGGDGLPKMDSTRQSWSKNHNTQVSVDHNQMNVSIIGKDGDIARARWNSFNVDNGKTVNFKFSGKNQTSINYIADTNMSKIYGSITKSGNTGSVILLNPNGFIFGETAKVNLNSFTAVALKGTYDFSKKQLNLTKTDNAGTITIKEGAKFKETKDLRLVSAKEISIENTQSLNKNNKVELYFIDKGKISATNNNLTVNNTTTNFNLEENIHLTGNVHIGKLGNHGHIKVSEQGNRPILGSNKAILKINNGNIVPKYSIKKIQ